MRIVIGLPLVLLFAGCGTAERAEPPAAATTAAELVAAPAPAVAEPVAAAALDGGGWRLPAPVPGGGAEGVARDGSRIVLEAADDSGQLLVLTPASGAQEEIDLAAQGDFSYDALSRDGRMLFLNEHRDGEAVRIRVYDLAGGGLSPDAVVDKVEPGEAMAGVAVARDRSPDGSMVYTLYRGRHHAFVHALMVDGPVSYCVDLPGAVPPAAGTWSIGVSPDGARVEAIAAGERHALQIDASGVPRVVAAA